MGGIAGLSSRNTAVMLYWGICSCCSAIAAVMSAQEGGLPARMVRARGRGRKEERKLSSLQKPGRAGRVYDSGCRGQGMAAEGPDSGARAGTAVEQAQAWGSSSSELGMKEQGCSVWLATTNDSFSSRHLLIDNCVTVQAHMNNCCLKGWGMWRAGEKKPLEMV